MTMKLLAAILLMSAVGCQQAQPPKRLLVVDNGYYRQYFWDGGDECGYVQGLREGNSTILAGYGLHQRYFARFEDAVRWVERECPNAVSPTGGRP